MARREPPPRMAIAALRLAWAVGEPIELELHAPDGPLRVVGRIVREPDWRVRVDLGAGVVLVAPVDVVAGLRWCTRSRARLWPSGRKRKVTIHDDARGDR